jgi:glycosyltransferase involved in cell wall biosynthesis
MRLGFHYHIPAVSKQDGIYMPGYLGRFIDSLAGFCEKVVCFQHSPRDDELEHMDYRITSPNVEWVNIGPHDSVIKRTIFASRYTRHVRSYAGKLDILLVRGPSPLLPAMVSASPVPTALLLVGDYLKGVDDLPQPRWRKEAIRLWSRWNQWTQLRAARRRLTFVNSRVLYEELSSHVPNLHEIRTTTLTVADFFERQDTCQSGPPYKLLYVGRIDRAKGLLNMVEAVALLAQRGEEVSLDLVGWPEPGDPILDDLQACAHHHGIEGRINYLGMRSMGEDLFACYRAADLYLIASMASEGFPRTIWEAMANSLPVIATDVGSIRYLLNGNAVIVPPNRPDLLSDAILQLLYDKNLRHQLIKAGFEQAKSMTLELQTKKLYQLMQHYCVNYKDLSKGTKQ